MVEHNLSVVADLSRPHHRVGARRNAGRRHLYRACEKPCRHRSLSGDRRWLNFARHLRPARLLRRFPRAARRDSRRAGWRSRHHRRPQRRRQDDDAARDHGHDREAHRLDQHLRASNVIAAPPEKIARLGVAYVPEERGIYASLDVTENLLLPRKINDRGMSLEKIYELFPNLQDAPPLAGHPAFRRRAADAGDRARAAHRRFAVPARRADRGPRAGHRAADRQGDRVDEDARVTRSCWSSRTSASRRRSPTATT